MKKTGLALIAALVAGSCHAYDVRTLYEDCQVAETIRPEVQADAPPGNARGARCLGYIMGIADGYAVGEYLASQVGVQLNAFCLPRDPDLQHRLLRAVLIQLERMPPQSNSSTASVVAGAIAKTFPCNTLESK